MKPIMYLVSEWDHPEFYPSIEDVKKAHPSPPISSLGELYEDGSFKYFTANDLIEQGVVIKTTPTVMSGSIGETKMETIIRKLSQSTPYEWAY